MGRKRRPQLALLLAGCAALAVWAPGVDGVSFVSRTAVWVFGPGTARAGVWARASPGVFPGVADLPEQSAAPFALRQLPYPPDALEPWISAETVAYHYGGHHAAYIRTLNQAASQDPQLASLSLEEIVRQRIPKVFNAAAQVWNHDFFWDSMAPVAGEPDPHLAEQLNKSFGGMEEFKAALRGKAMQHFGSGWLWLVRQGDGSLGLVTTQDAENPVASPELGHPLLVCDLWEHAYYVDHRNRKAAYVDGWLELINWEFASTQFQAA
eukprot:CAMPEP_0204352596 /NCGR_PEP_ID=MMETSP0469-20131031/32006_1 /ASSEMBLY_ACC=CAM_ASM_000384 /TAXON_ID=2969 /ORGANISM="Oxyrrhis marina" /LENGTH=265 /DNA_ID=CAMNT_0051339355 /DNA_START=15 /DNA_END=808 /DNA_ORIENTATION=+